jgi:hypothetical protein
VNEELEPDEAFASEEEMDAAYDQSVGEGTPNTAPERHVRYDYDESVDPWTMDDPWQGDDDAWDDESPNPQP